MRERRFSLYTRASNGSRRDSMKPKRTVHASENSWRIVQHRRRPRKRSPRQNYSCELSASEEDEKTDKKLFRKWKLILFARSLSANAAHRTTHSTNNKFEI